MFIKNKIFERKNLLKFLLNLNTLTKKLILIIIDTFCFLISFVFSLWLLNDDKFTISILIDYLWIFPAAIIIGIPLYLFTGQYKEITRYISSTLSYKLLKRNAILTFSIILVGQLFNFPTLSLKF